jgi:lipopolysaccharide export system protein LptA
VKRSQQKTAKVPPAKLIKPALAAALVVVIGTILVYFIVHLKRRPIIPPDNKEIAQQKIEVQEKVDFFDFKGKIKVKAARRYLGEDNLYHLVGPVEIVDRGKKGGGEISISGESVIYDKDMKHFAMQGKVKVRSQGVLLEAEHFDYNREEEIFKTESGIVLSSPRFSGSAKQAVYALKENAISLEDDVEFKIVPRLENPEPLQFKADKLTYSVRDRKGRIESRTDEFPISLLHGKSRGRAALIEFEQFYDDDDLKMLCLKGRVKVTLDEKGNVEPQKKTKKPGKKAVPGGPQQGREWDFFRSEKQEIEAEEIKIKAFLNLPELHALESKGGCFFKFISASGEQTHVQGEAVDFIFNRGAKLREFRVFEGARISSLLEDNRPDRLIEGMTMILDGETQIIRVQGKNDAPARFTSQRNEVTAEAIEISIQDDSFGAMGGAKAVLRPQMDPDAAPGFFAKDKPVFANAMSMRYSAGEKRFILSGQAKMWQDKEVLLGQEVAFNEETGEMQGQGDIKSFFPHTPKEGEKEERVEISAERMSYEPKVHQMIYEGAKDRCSLITRNVVLRAGLITVLPGEVAGKARSMRATKNVTIVQEAKEAVGETADYDVEKDTMVLTGRPVLTLKDKSTVRGDKLTFRLGDGTILVENQDQQRSVAVIKS